MAGKKRAMKRQALADKLVAFAAISQDFANTCVAWTMPQAQAQDEFPHIRKRGAVGRMAPVLSASGMPTCQLRENVSAQRLTHGAGNLRRQPAADTSAQTSSHMGTGGCY